MERYTLLWWATILLSSVVTGGSTFVSLALFTDLSIQTIVTASVTLVLVGDIVLALMMEAFSPTRITVGPGEIRLKRDLPIETGTVIGAFENRRGAVEIRGERWRARQAKPCSEILETGSTVRVVEREGLTLVVEGERP